MNSKKKLALSGTLRYNHGSIFYCTEATDLKKTLGILGGLGPMATAYLYEQITRMTDAASDQAHMEILLFSHPAIPDRTAFLLGQSTADPVPELIATGRRLVNAGAQVLAVPCVTAHAMYGRFAPQLGAPVIRAVRETAAYLKGAGVQRVGLLATTGTLQTGTLHRALESVGISVCQPSPVGQAKIMDVIYRDVKAGNAANMADFSAAADELRAMGAQVLLLGCTELSVVKRDNPLGTGYLDVLDVLAMCAVRECGYPLKGEFENLIR